MFQDFNLLATAMIAGHGVALCPTDVFREELRRGDIVVLSDITLLADQHYCIATRANPSPTVALFTDWFRALTAENYSSADA